MFLLLLFSDRAASDAPFCPAFSKAGEMFPLGNARAARPSGKPRSFIARAACCPDRGMLSMQWKAPERETGLFFLLLQKEPKSSCSDVQKVASGKFLCVGDRRNRENCERM